MLKSYILLRFILILSTFYLVILEHSGNILFMKENYVYFKIKITEMCTLHSH